MKDTITMKEYLAINEIGKDLVFRYVCNREHAIKPLNVQQFILKNKNKIKKIRKMLDFQSNEYVGTFNDQVCMTLPFDPIVDTILDYFDIQIEDEEK